MEIFLPDLPLAFDGLRVVQLSDLHVQPDFPAEALKPALSLAAAAQPDLLVLTGDYINDRAGRSGYFMRECAETLAPLATAARLGAFVSFGNHDFPPPPEDPPRALWQDNGYTPLLDSAVPIRSEGASLWLVGLRSAVQRPTNPTETLATTTTDKTVRIVLWHEPDGAPLAADAGASLMLSGHTHGGQAVIPGFGPVWLPVQGRRYTAGHYQVGKMALYVTRGVGALPPVLRLACPPEVSLLILRRGAPRP